MGSMDYYVHQLATLFNYRIVNVARDDENGFFGLVVQSPQGKKKIIWFFRDDEANGAGSFGIDDFGEE